MSAKTPLEIVQASYMAFGAGDMTAFLADMSPDVEWHSGYAPDVPLNGVWRGHDGVITLVQTIGASVDIHQFQVVEFIAQGDKVVVLGFEEAAAKSTGRSYRNEWAHVWTVREGRVARIRTYNDSATVAAAFGP